MPTAAELITKISVVGVDQYARDMDKADKTTASAASNMDKAGKSAGGLSTALGLGVKAAAGVTLGVGALGGVLGKVGFDFNSMKQQSEIAFTTILGDAQKARDFMGQIGQFAAKTPFELGPLTQYASRLAAVGTDTERIIPIMTRLGDATSGMGTGAEGIQRAVTALTQMQQKGKVTGEEMLQLTEAGIPAWESLAAVLGTDVAHAQEMVTKRQVDANKIFEAIETGAGPAFQRLNGMMDKQSHSFSGLISTAKDTFAQFAGTVTAPIFEMATKGLQGLTDAMSTPVFAEFGQRTGQLIASALSSIGRAAAQIGPDLLAAFQTFGASVGPQVLSIFQQLTPVVREAVAALLGFAQTDILPKVQAFGTVIQSTVLPAMIQFAQVVSQQLGPPLMQVFGFIGEHQEILGGLAAVVGGVLVVSFTAWAVAAGAAAVATIAAAAPVIALGVALAALAAGIIYVVKNWDEITQRFPLLGTAADAVKGVIDGLAGALSDFGSVILPELSAAWETTAGNITAIAGSIQGSIEGVFNGIRGFLQAHSTEIQTVIQGAWDAIVVIVNTVTGIISNDIQFWLNILQGDWSGAWQNVKNIVQITWDGIRDLTSIFLSQVFPALLTLGLDAIKALWNAAWNEIKASVDNAINGENGVLALVRAMPGAILAALADIGSLLWNAGWSLIHGMIEGAQSLGDELIDTVRGLVQGAIDAAWEVIKPGSPSEEGRAMTINLFQGMISGASEMGGALKEKMISLAKEALEGLKATLSNAGGAILGPGVAPGGPLSFGGSLGGDVDGWLQQAMQIAGVGPDWLPGLRQLVQLESGGNPNAVNPQAVIQNGVNYGHATGLLQTLPGTFAANNSTGGSITDPVANAVAAINYIKRTYGHVNNAVANHAARGGYAKGGKAPYGWGVVGEEGWERFHYGPGGLTIFPHEISKAMGPMGGIRGYAGGSGMGATPGGSKGSNDLAEKYAAYIAGTRTQVTEAAFWQGQQMIADYMADLAEMTAQANRQLENVKLGDEIRRFADWVKQFGEEWLKQLLATQGPEAAFQAFHGRSTRSLDQGSGSVTVVLNVDGREFARATAPAISAQMAAQMSSTMGGY
jgi:tape measure domain-containing protein